MNLPDMVENGGDMYNWQIPAIYRNQVRRNKNLTRLQVANTHIRDITPIAGPGIMALVRAEVTNYDPNFNNTHCRVMLDVDPHDRPPNTNIQVTGLAPQTVSFVWEVDNMALAHHGCLACSCDDWLNRGDAGVPGSTFVCKHIQCVLIYQGCLDRLHQPPHVIRR